MGVLQVLIFVTSAVLVLENGSWMVECAPRGGSYSYTTVHRSSSGNTNAVAASQQHTAAGTSRQGQFGTTDYRKYLPVEDTPEVKTARAQFFKLYEKQARLASDAPDINLDGTYTHNQVAAGNRNDYYDYYDYTSEEDDDEDDDDEEESEEDYDDDDDDDDDDDEEDSDEYDDDSSSSSSSSSSEEDYYGYDSSSEEGESSSSEESSEEDYGEDSSSSSSSSSSSEEDGSPGAVYSWHTNSLVAPKPVTDTPEVKQAKRKFFDLYKEQAQLSFDAPDNY